MLDKVKLKQLKQLMSLCKKEGAITIEFEGIKIEFSPYLVSEAKAKSKSKKASNNEPEVETTYSDEDILLWSSAPVGVVNG
jgi:hypothetical protein